MKEPSEPDALAAACFADAVHAIVPIPRTKQRQAVAADRKTEVERARAVFIQRAALFGDDRLKVGLGFAGRERRAFKKRYNLVEDGEIIGDLGVVSGGE